MNIAEIVKQLKLCNYECIAGKLENNVAFMELEKRGESEYQSDRYLGEKVFTNMGFQATVHNLKACFSGIEGGYVQPSICKDICQGSSALNYSELFTPEEFKEREIAEALEVLKKHNYNV